MNHRRPRNLSVLIGLILLLSGCAGPPFLSKDHPEGDSPRDQARAILELEYRQQELARQQAILQETLNTLKGTLELLQGESVKSKAQVENLAAKIATLDDRFTVVQAGLEVKLIQLREAIQKELEAALQALQAAQAALKEEVEKLRASGIAPKPMPQRSRQPR